MRYVDGRIFIDPTLENLSPDERSKIYANMIDTLCKIHTVDLQAAGLNDYGKHGKIQ